MIHMSQLVCDLADLVAAYGHCNKRDIRVMNDLLSCRRTNCISLFFLCMSFSVSADVLDEIIVTAQKREQDIQDVSIAVTLLFVVNARRRDTRRSC